jgi:hypothetical protein
VGQHAPDGDGSILPHSPAATVAPPAPAS